MTAPHPERLYPADSTIIAAGQAPKDKIVSTTTGLDVTARILLGADEQGETTRAGVFASGDVVLGAKTVVEAVRYSKRAADAMGLYARAGKRPFCLIRRSLSHHFLI